ncbi:hypothetical protein AEAC466_16925 [Asticcacaulis sp. AC466]|uniref:alpha/beta hydrolase n=1 Tax=Asticcacaulis sp. AC466 TaxID=1282362 RepID=UPI0003C3FB8E|nr:alpha/beta hydrolase [Asticcacaulis sp. AC466]ESQ82549.1 hypothetical protein AEAC466_16925 [Asticcacaulis sp. AC466]
MIRFVLLAAVAVLGLAGSAMAEPIAATPAEQVQLDALYQPEDWFVSHLKGPRETANGAILDARLQYVLETVTRPASAPAVQAYLRSSYATAQGRDAARTALDRYWALRTLETAAMQTVSDDMVTGRAGDGIAVRIYQPKSTEKRLPVLVYYHGGGFMFGSIEGWDRAMRLIANEGRVIVVSVAYRLAPEHPYPAAWNDAEDAYDWTLSHIRAFGGDARAVAVGGDSAGGTLAISVALRAAKAKKTGPSALLLYYPGVDREGVYPSMKTFGTGYGLDADALAYLAGLVYPAGSATTSADTSPMQADLCPMPQSLIVTAGFDPLSGSQLAFAARLKDKGCPVEVRTYGTLIHAFLQTTGYVPDAAAAATETARRFGEMVRHPAKGRTCK